MQRFKYLVWWILATGHTYITTPKTKYINTSSLSSLFLFKKTQTMYILKISMILKIIIPFSWLKQASWRRYEKHFHFTLGHMIYLTPSDKIWVSYKLYTVIRQLLWGNNSINWDHCKWRDQNKRIPQLNVFQFLPTEEFQLRIREVKPNTTMRFRQEAVSSRTWTQFLNTIRWKRLLGISGLSPLSLGMY